MKKNVFLKLIFFLFLCIHTLIRGQANVDSLKSVVESSQTSSEKLNAAIELAHILLKSGNKETKKYLDIAKHLLEENPDSLNMAKVKNFYAQYYVLTGDYEKATQNFLSTIKICERLKNIKLKNSALNGLAQLNIRTKNYEKGISIYKQLLEYAKQTKNKNDILFYSLNLAMANGEGGNLKESEKYFIEVYNSNPKNKFYKAVAANNLSFIYNNTNKYYKALKYGKEAAEYSKKVSDDAFKIESLTNYSNALKGVGENSKADKIIREIIALSRKNNYIRKMNNAIGNLALNYEAMGNYESAYKYYKDFAERRDSLLNESTTAKINELQIKYETAEKDRIIKEKNDAIERKNFALLLTIAAVVLFVSLFLLIFILYRKKNLAYKELVKKNLEIINTERRLLKNERNESERKKYLSSSLSDEKKENLNKKLFEAINEEKIFLNPDITLGILAQKFGVNSKYLSQVIHEYYNSGFPDFINQLRIKEAARLLSDKSYGHLSMEGISEMVGFHTKSSFNVYFKKYIGVTPSFFATTSQNINRNED